MSPYTHTSDYQGHLTYGYPIQNLYPSEDFYQQHQVSVQSLFYDQNDAFYKKLLLFPLTSPSFFSHIQSTSFNINSTLAINKRGNDYNYNTNVIDQDAVFSLESCHSSTGSPQDLIILDLISKQLSLFDLLVDKQETPSLRKENFIILQKSILAARDASNSNYYNENGVNSLLYSSHDIQVMAYDNLSNLVTEIYSSANNNSISKNFKQVEKKASTSKESSFEFEKVTTHESSEGFQEPPSIVKQEQNDGFNTMYINPREPNRNILRRIGNAIKEAGKSLLLFIVILTITSHLSHAFYMYLHGDALRAEFDADPGNEVKEMSAQADFTVFMVTKNRNTYKETMPKFMEIPSRLKPFYLIIDYESDTPIESVPGAYVLHKKLDSDKPTNFNVWKGLAYASKAIKSKKVFYFDSCNFPTGDWTWDKYLDNNTNLYYPNNERAYTGNFLAYRDDFERFIEDLPLHLAIDPRSFFGNDQVLIWYFSSWLGQYMIHITHEALAGYEEQHPHHIAIWRLFLYMNRYARPVMREDEMYTGKCRDQKEILCVYGGIVAKFLALPGVWHFIDALMNLEIIFRLIFALVNLTHSWFWAFTISITVTFTSIIISMHFVRKGMWWTWVFLNKRISKDIIVSEASIIFNYTAIKL